MSLPISDGLVALFSQHGGAASGQRFLRNRHGPGRHSADSGENRFAPGIARHFGQRAAKLAALHIERRGRTAGNQQGEKGKGNSHASVCAISARAAQC